ncbi:ferredoxin reductase-like protein [Stipitochalara longipes BDJ]|nr:ferredoxin reductase-like protein [Stipitochalara longipes BDJ]
MYLSTPTIPSSMTSRFLVGQLPLRLCMNPDRSLTGPLLRLALSYRHFSTQNFLNHGATSTSKRNAAPSKVSHEDQQSVLARLSRRGEAPEQLIDQTQSPRLAVKSSRAWLGWLGGASVLLAIGASLLNSPGDPDGKPFDPPRFSPFTVVKREVVSPTSVILTVRRYANGTEDLYKDMWDRGIWSVEVKQPELQISRSYTPLPPIKPIDYSELRFLIRKEHKGEVSGYLHRLGLSSQIELRGPHSGFDIPEDVAEVVFLAGGTGIAPALQAAYTTLERRNTEARVRIVWSNRWRDDCQGGGQLNRMDHQQLGLVVQELETLQNKHPGRLSVDYLVDQENKFLNQKMITQLTQISGRSNLQGPKLLLISGPEGFVNHFAGPKRWEGGKEGQGVVAGVIGNMKLHDWTIWKL